MIKIAVCDDEPIIATQIESLIIELANSLNKKIDTEVYHSGRELSKHIGNGEYFDIIYMDIEMAEMNGIEAGKWLREAQNNETTLLIYVSSHDKYHSQLFDVQPYNFIRKPIDNDEFKRIFDKACQKAYNSKDFIAFSFNRENIKLDYSEIIYFKSDKRTIHVYTKDKNYQFYDKLSNIIENMNLNNFVQIHKSYVVNLDYIKAINLNKIIIANGIELSISQTYQKYTNQRYLLYLKEKL